MARRAHTLDSVKLTRDVAGWPAGTVGVVISTHPETALVEVSETWVDHSGLPTRGLLDDLVTVPYAALQVVESASAVAP